MKYKPCKATCCVAGCRRARRGGQRTCRKCHAAQQRAYRERKRAEAKRKATALGQLGRALKVLGYTIDDPARLLQ